jgi:hypothetical protein
MPRIEKGHSPEDNLKLVGKPKAFRTSVGTAADSTVMIKITRIISPLLITILAGAGFSLPGPI